MDRVFIGSVTDTKQFFQAIKLSASHSSWKEFCLNLNILRGNFWSFYSQTTSLPIDLYERLSKLLPVELQEEYNRKIKFLPKNWGQVIGGNVTHAIHPEIFENGRKILKYDYARVFPPKFNINQPLTTNLCEFLGAFAGDGFTNKYGRHYQIGFAGDKRYDREYYEKLIIPISKNLFNIQSHSYRERKNGMWINFHSKTLFEMLIQRFHMPAGVKFDKVRVPKEILTAEPKMKAAFIRGCMDTDGCVFFDKRPAYKTPYMRLDLCMYNPAILDEIKEMLAEFGIESQRLANNKHLQITSKENVRKYLEIVGLSNHRHIDKVLKMYPDFEEWNPVHL